MQKAPPWHDEGPAKPSLSWGSKCSTFFVLVVASHELNVPPWSRFARKYCAGRRSDSHCRRVCQQHRPCVSSWWLQRLRCLGNTLARCVLAFLLVCLFACLLVCLFACLLVCLFACSLAATRFASTYSNMLHCRTQPVHIRHAHTHTPSSVVPTSPHSPAPLASLRRH